MRSWIRRLWAVARRRRLDDDLTEEIRLHLDLRRQMLIDEGMNPSDAEREARRMFGNVTRISERTRDVRSFPSVESLLQDVRYGLRQLRRSPVFATAAILTLGLAIGATSTLFAIANAVLFRPLPYPDADRIVSITVASKGTDVERMDEPTASLALSTGVRAFEALATTGTAGANLTGGTQPERVSGARVSRQFFTVMGVQPALGRTFATDELQPGGPSAVILSESLWARAFARSPDVIDRTIRLDDRSYTIVGVMPAGFRYPYRSEFWQPMLPRKMSSGFYYTDFVGRLRPNVSIDHARLELMALRKAHELDQHKGVRNLDIRMLPLQERLYGSFRRSLLLLLGVVGCVLLIACANVANLLLARASTRRRELALRAAIGASRARLMRQLFIESILLATLGAMPGLALAYAGVRLFTAFGPAELTRIPGVAIDTEVMLFTLFVTIGTGLLFGVAPAVAAGRADPHEWLKSGRTTAVRGARSHPRRALVVFEFAAAVVLTLGAGLLAKSFIRFQAVDRGFQGDSVLTASVTLPSGRYEDEAARRAFFDSVLDRLRALPAVESASISPIGLSGMMMTMSWPPRKTAEGESPPISIVTDIGSHHFRTFGIPLIAGAECSTVSATPAAVINARMAARAFPGRSAIGEPLDLAAQGAYTVVGVAADVRRPGTNEPPLATVYACASRTETSLIGTIAVRARERVDPTTLVPALREAVRAADPAQPVSNVQTLAQMVGAAVTSRWFDAALVAAFAGLALIIAVFGLYAVMAYLVAQRTHEIGVRMALGASRRDVVRLVLREGGALTAVGLALGLSAAVPLVTLLRSMLYEVQPFDLPVFATLSVVLALVAMCAALVPARRAIHVDPLLALRAE